MNLREQSVATFLASYFSHRGLTSIGKFNVFNHVDDTDERTFIVDFAIGPVATKGVRSPTLTDGDNERFQQESVALDTAVEALMEACVFPTSEDRNKGWRRRPNVNPMVGIAIEIENARSKYFLGSLLAAAGTGRWGVLVVPETRDSERWVGTVRRLLHKGAASPIPSNITIFTWPALRAHIEALGIKSR